MDNSEIERLANAVVKAANAQTESQPGIALREAMNAVADHEQGGTICSQILAQLPAITAPAGAGILGIWFGATVEDGGDAERSLPTIWKTFLHWCGELERQCVEHEKPRTAGRSETPDGDENHNDNANQRNVENSSYGFQISSELATGLEYLSRAMVVHLARAESFRRELAVQPEVHDLLERVSRFAAGPDWVLELLRRHSGTVLVFHVETKTGYRVGYNNLSNCFHLFTLLQCALSRVLPECRNPTHDILRVAEGEYPVEAFDEAWWHYGDGRSSLPEAQASIWGEASPAKIPDVGGEAVILLWPPILRGRSWNVGEFGPPLPAAPASLTILETLPEPIVRGWWTTLGLDSAPGITHPKAETPWWKFWQR